MIPFCTYSTMDDVLIEMEAIREFVGKFSGVPFRTVSNEFKNSVR